MGIDYEKAIALKQSLAAKLIPREGRENVHAIGLAVQDNPDEFRVQVFLTTDQYSGQNVSEAKSRLPVDENVDYFYAPPVSALQVRRISIDPTSIFETLIPGISIGTERLTDRYGTLGYFCSRNDETTRSKSNYILSNAHVLADMNSDCPMARSWIKQPGPGDGVGIKVGELTDLTPIVFSPDRTVVNHVDAAIARVNSSIKIDSRFPNFGAINGTTRYSNIRTNILCQKFGRTTLRTSGKVLTTDALVEVEYGRKKKAWFDNQVFLEPTDASQPFCGSGDSGSLVVDMNMYALGLLFAGTNLPPEQAKALSDHLLEATGMSLLQFGVANPIEAVETALNIELM